MSLRHWFVTQVGLLCVAGERRWTAWMKSTRTAQRVSSSSSDTPFELRAASQIKVRYRREKVGKGLMMAEVKERAVDSVSHLPCSSKGLNYQCVPKYFKAGISVETKSSTEIFYVPVSCPNTLSISFYRILIKAPWERYSEYAHFTNVKAKIQRVWVTCPKVNKYGAAVVGAGAQSLLGRCFTACYSKEPAEKSHFWGPFH